MSPIFYEDSLGEKLAEKAKTAMAAAREADAERGRNPETVALATGDDGLVDDPEALAAAERRVRGIDPEEVYEQFGEDWVVILGPSKVSGITDEAGFTSRQLTGPLDDAGIPFAWDPYPPEEMPTYRPGYGAVDRPFTWLVPPSRAEEARTLLDPNFKNAGMYGVLARQPRGEDWRSRSRVLLWPLLILFSFGILVQAVSFLLKVVDVLLNR